MQVVLDEKILLKQIADNDQQAFTRIFKTYQPIVYKYMLLFTRIEAVAEELTQDVFFKLWDNRATIKEIPLLKAWLLRVAKNLVVDYIRREQVKFKVLVMYKSGLPHATSDTEESIAIREYNKIAGEAINLLTDKRKLIFKLSVEEGLSHDDIAEKLQISKSVVKKQLYASLDLIKAHLNKEGGIVFKSLLLAVTIHGQQF